MILVFLQWLNAPKRDGNHNIDWLHRYFVQIINKERHQHIKAQKKKKKQGNWKCFQGKSLFEIKQYVLFSRLAKPDTLTCSNSGWTDGRTEDAFSCQCSNRACWQMGEIPEGSFSFPPQNAWGYFFVPSFPEVLIKSCMPMPCVCVCVHYLDFSEVVINFTSGIKNEPF